MKRLFILLISLILPIWGCAQVLKIENGIAISNLTSPINNYDYNVKSYIGALSISYLNFPFYEITSSVGLYKKGGVKDFPLYNDNGINIAENVCNKIKYIHLGTNIRGKLPIGNLSLFIGCGPKLDILTKSKSNVDKVYLGETALNLADTKLRKFVFGITPEIGIMYDFNKMRLELDCMYIYDINYMDKKEFKLKGNTLAFILSVGYKL